MPGSSARPPSLSGLSNPVKQTLKEVIFTEKRDVIKNWLKKLGVTVKVTDGEQEFEPFFAVIEMKWRSDKTGFEVSHTPAGRVSADYCTYIGPYDFPLETLSNRAVLTVGGVQYTFKKWEAITCNNTTCFYTAVLRRLWGCNDVQPT